MEACARDNGAGTPRRFCLDGREFDVVNVLDQWQGPGYHYFKVRGHDGSLCLLRLDQLRSEWKLIARVQTALVAFAHSSSNSLSSNMHFQVAKVAKRPSRKSFASAGPRHPSKYPLGGFERPASCHGSFFDLAQSAKQICDGTN